MNLSVRPYCSEDETSWDKFCNDSFQGTLLHSRRYLSYHGSRFSDCSLIIEDKNQFVGLLPAAQNPNDLNEVISHPGITYGGLIHQGKLRGERMIDAFCKVIQFFSEQNYRSLNYKAVPTFYHKVPAQDDLYALFRLGAERKRCDLSSLINLHSRLPLNERRKRSLRKALKAGVLIVEGSENFHGFWDVLTENLERKHGTIPVHSLDEIILLASRFPEKILCICAKLSDQIIAGIVVFSTTTAFHAQYIASNELGYHVSALDVVFDYAIKLAQSQNKNWFNFGISTENQGQKLNENLYRFKNEFGGGGFVHEFYQIKLNNTAYVIS